MPINPVQFAHSACDEFLRYIFSEFPLSDPKMESHAKELLDRSSLLDIPQLANPAAVDHLAGEPEAMVAPLWSGAPINSASIFSFSSMRR